MQIRVIEIIHFGVRKGGGRGSEYRVQTLLWNICYFEATLPLKKLTSKFRARQFWSGNMTYNGPFP